MKKFIELIKDFKDFRDFKKEFIEFSVLREKFKKGQEILNLLDELQVIEIKMRSRFIALDVNYASKVSRQRKLETALEKKLKEYS